jgi:hypothetical protein
MAAREPARVVEVAKLLGDPLSLAEYQFRTAHELCGSCRGYHALWPYRRLADPAVGGVEPDVFAIEPALRQAIPAGGRILIAGCADAGMLDVVVRATRAVTPVIHVIDRCATPLAVCRRFAEQRGFAVTTHHMDPSEADVPGRYDVVFAHCVLPFIPEERRSRFLRRLANCLTPNGTAVMCERQRISAGARMPPDVYAAQLIAALHARQIALPESEPAFQSRVEQDYSKRGERRGVSLDAVGFRRALADGGFEITGFSEVERTSLVSAYERTERFTVFVAAARVSPN